MTRSERHFLQRLPLRLLVIFSRFQRRQRSEAETIQQSTIGRCDLGPSQLHTLPDWFSICGPVTERWVLLSWRLRPANAANPGGVKP